MIGVNILQNPKEFQQAFDAGHDIAVHTYTHPYMTTLSNLDVVAQVNICAFFFTASFHLLKFVPTAWLDNATHPQFHRRACPKVLEASLWRL